jgi:hypothetical protein
MAILVTDRAGYAVTRRELLDNGYLKVPGKVARTGVQYYLASELGLTDRKPNEIIGVYRPSEEVFSADSLASYDNADVTDDHPSDMVNAASFKDVAVGHAISAGRQEAEFVVVDLLIKDQKAIEAIQAGKAELSAGYTAEYIPQQGVSDAGEAYEFIQRGIRINHIALVDKARAGKEARLFDTKPKEAITMTHVTLDNGATVEVADKATAQLLQSAFDGLRKRVQDAEGAAAKADEEKEKMEAAKDEAEEKLEEEKKKSSDAAIGERIKSVIDAQAQARKIAGEKFSCDSLDVSTIRRAALAVVRPAVDWAAKSDHYVQAAWDMEMEKDEDERDKEKGKESQDALNKDLKNLYTGDNGQMVGTAAYQNFLNGGAK